MDFAVLFKVKDWLRINRECWLKYPWGSRPA